MDITPVSSGEEDQNDIRERPPLRRSKSESSAQLPQHRNKSKSPAKEAEQSAAAESRDEPWKTQLANIQHLMDAVLLFLACIVKQEISPLPTSLQPKVLIPKEGEPDQTPKCNWEVVRRQLDTTLNDLNRWWKDFDSGFGTLLGEDGNSNDTHADTNKATDGDLYMELKEAISGITPPLAEFAALLESLVDTSCSNSQIVDPVLHHLTNELKKRLDDLGPPEPTQGDSKGSSALASSGTKTEMEPLEHHMSSLKELQDSLIDISIPLQAKLQVQILSKDFRRQTKAHRSSDSKGIGQNKKRRVRFEQSRSGSTPPHQSRVPARAKGASRPRSLSFGAKSSTLVFPNFSLLPREGASLAVWSEIKTTISQLSKTRAETKQSRINVGDFIAGESSQVVIRMSTDENAFITSSPPDDNDEVDKVTVADVQEELVKSDDVDALHSTTSAFQKMDLDVTGADLASEAVLALIKLFPDSRKSWTAFNLPSSLQKALFRNCAVRSLLDNFSQWSIITHKNNTTLASSLLGLFQETLIDQVLGSMDQICDHSSDIFGDSPSVSMSHVVCILDESMNHLLRIHKSIHLDPICSKLEPELLSASEATSRTSSRLSLHLARQAKPSTTLKKALSLDIISVPPLRLLLYLTSGMEDPQSLRVSSGDLDTSFIRLTPGTARGFGGECLEIADKGFQTASDDTNKG